MPHGGRATPPADYLTGALASAARARPRLVDRPLTVVLPRVLLPAPLADASALVVQPSAQLEGLGLWVRLDRAGRAPACGWWAAEPASGRRAWARARDVWPWLHALLAALWTDLCSNPYVVYGGAARRWLAGQGGMGGGRSGPLLLPGRVPAGEPSLLLWPDDEERPRLIASADVSHFFRRLPDGWQNRVDDPAFQQRQAVARARARAFGCDLPENAGLTFVRDFVRGAGAAGTPGHTPRSVRSAGLLRLAVMLRQMP